MLLYPGGTAAMHARTTAGAPSASAFAPPNFLTSTCVMLLR